MLALLTNLVHEKYEYETLVSYLIFGEHTPQSAIRKRKISKRDGHQEKP